MENDLQKQLENIEILKVLIRGKEFKIDEMDNINQSTPLLNACELLYNVEVVKVLVEYGEADVNCVNKDDAMPLKVVKERIKKEQDKAKKANLDRIYSYL